jgi:hypothetical protein
MFKYSRSRYEQTVTTMRKQPVLLVLVVCSLFGVFFFSILAHEVLHVVHGEGAKSVCIDFNQKISDSTQQGYMTAHTVFDPKAYSSVEEFYTFRELTEKYASILQYVVMIGAAFVLGVVVTRAFG